MPSHSSRHANVLHTEIWMVRLKRIRLKRSGGHGRDGSPTLRSRSGSPSEPADARPRLRCCRIGMSGGLLQSRIARQCLTYEGFEEALLRRIHGSEGVLQPVAEGQEEVELGNDAMLFGKRGYW